MATHSVSLEPPSSWLGPVGRRRPGHRRRGGGALRGGPRWRAREAVVGSSPRLLSAIAADLHALGHVDRRRRLASEALAMARETGDGPTLSAVLATTHVAIDGRRQFAQAWFDLTEERLAVAAREQDPEGSIDALIQLIGTQAALGDVVAAQSRLDEGERIADGLRLPRFRWHILSTRAMLAVLTGDLDQAERDTMQAHGFGQASDVSEGYLAGMLGSLLFPIRYHQGRIGELVPAMEDLVGIQPEFPVWRVGFAAALARSGRPDEAQAPFDWLTAEDSARVPRDVMFPVTLCGLGTLCLALGVDAGDGSADLRPAAPPRRHLQLDDHHRPAAQRSGAWRGRFGCGRIRCRRSPFCLVRRAVRASRRPTGPGLDPPRLGPDPRRTRQGRGGRGARGGGASHRRGGRHARPRRPDALRSEAARRPVSTSGLVLILFTDLVGSTGQASEIGDLAADELRRTTSPRLREAVAATGGTEVKTIGDALMVSYTGAADALAGAAAMQRAVERHNRRAKGPALAMRIGVSAGDATFEDDDWFGTPVIEAARLCAAAEGGQILVSDLVRALAGSRTELELRSARRDRAQGTARAGGGVRGGLAVAETEAAVPAAGVRRDDPGRSRSPVGSTSSRCSRSPGRRPARAPGAWCSSPASPASARRDS